MYLAEWPGICKKLQFLVADSALSTWNQDSKLKKKILNPTSLNSRFKIKDPEKTS
jgi:hypothetical protein